VGFVRDKVALGNVFSEYFSFPCQFSFHWLLLTHHISSGAGTIGKLVADVPSGLSLTSPPPPQKTNLWRYGRCRKCSYRPVQQNYVESSNLKPTE
jgi:hypothetical protein